MEIVGNECSTAVGGSRTLLENSITYVPSSTPSDCCPGFNYRLVNVNYRRQSVPPGLNDIRLLIYWKRASAPSDCWVVGANPAPVPPYPQNSGQGINMCVGDVLVYFTDADTGEEISFGVSPNGSTPPTTGDFNTYCGEANPCPVTVLPVSYQLLYFNIANNSSGWIPCLP
jgi:hypothetical protein